MMTNSTAAVEVSKSRVYPKLMRSFFPASALVVLVLVSTSLSQLPPTTVHKSSKPTLKRDRTQRILYPRIIQYEDERTVNSELVEALLPPHGGVRKRAVLALGRIGYPSGLAPLIDLMTADMNPENRDSEIRALAAFSLGQIQSQHAVSALLERLDPTIEKSLLVKARAIEALGKIGSNKYAAAALGEYGVKGIAEAIANVLPDAAVQLTPQQKLTASLALTALMKLRQASTVDKVASQLRSGDSDLRWQAANALARMREGIGPSVPALIGLLADNEPLVRASAARALGVAKAAPAVDPLIKLLTDKDQRVIATAISALGAIGDAKAVDPLMTLGAGLFNDYRAYDRSKLGVPPPQNLLLLIASALGNLRNEKALPFLKSLRLTDTRLGAFPETEIALAKFGEAAFFDIPQTVKLASDDWKGMSAYAQGLGAVGTEKAKATLLDLLGGTTYGKPDVRALPAILNAMSAAKVSGLRETLLDQLKNQDVYVRSTCAELLAGLGDSSDKVISAIYDAYHAARTDKVNDARIALVEAASKLKHPMNILVLSDGSRDDDYVVRLKAADLLRESPTEVSIGKLTIGKVETGHDRAYWRHIADLSATSQNPIAVITTKKGAIRIELLASDAPMTVDNFIKLARSGFYNGLAFVRVVPNFVIQGGDPRGDQNGGPGYQIRDEINLQRYQTGTVGMALSGKDTGGSQFFITHSPQPHLDGGYTIFGKVIEGMDVVNSIARGDVMERVEIIEQK